MRIGHGYDVHRLGENRKLILGGVDIPYDMGLCGHSDADVLIHALMDALIGAMGMGDIGQHFPDTDPAFSGISSMILLEKVCAMLEHRGFFVSNLDATIIAQSPKLMPYIPEMKQNIEKVLHIAHNQINIKATTEEGLGFTGTGEGIAAHAVVLLLEKV